MPVQQAAEKSEHEQKLFLAIKRHILNERKRKREEMEAEVEEERQRKEREANKKKHAMTLGETKEQIQLQERKLEDLKKEKDTVFIKLKEMMNKEAVLKRQSAEREVPQEVFPVVSKPPPHMQNVFLPPRATVYQPPPPSGNIVSHIGIPMPTAVKRKQSPSPQSNNSHGPPPPPPQIAYHRQPPNVPEATLLAPRGDDHRRPNDGRAVLWTTKPQLLRHEASMPAAFVADHQLQHQYRQSGAGSMHGYPPPPQNAQPPPQSAQQQQQQQQQQSQGPPKQQQQQQPPPPQQQIYGYPIAIRHQGYHMDMIPGPGQHNPVPPQHHQVASQHPQSLKPDVQIKSSLPASIYHIDSRQMQKPPDRHVAYHPQDVKHDDHRSPELRQSHYELAAAGIRRDPIHMYPNPNLLQLSQQAQVVKTGSITQGYPTRSPSSNQPPHPQHPHYPNMIQQKNSFHRF